MGEFSRLVSDVLLEARGAPLSVFNSENAKDAAKVLESKINAPVVEVTVSTLGGSNRVSIIIKMSLDERKDWQNGIFHNSRYAMISFENDGSLEMFNAGHFGPTPSRETRIKRLRKSNVKTPEEAAIRINDWIKKTKKLTEGIITEAVWWPFNKGNTEIWYMKPDYFRDGSMGYSWNKTYNTLPDKKNLKATHVLLGKMDLKDPNQIFREMQGEYWSPEGQSRSLIRGKGLAHTSMSVGDIIKIGSKVIMIDNIGFKTL